MEHFRKPSITSLPLMASDDDNISQTSMTTDPASGHSVNIQTMVQFTCPHCNSVNSSLQTLRFSPRNKLPDFLQCINCGFVQVQLGGSRSPPATRRPAAQTGDGSDDAEPSAAPRHSASLKEYKPIISSALASSAHFPTPFAITEPDQDTEDDIQIMHFRPDTTRDKADSLERDSRMLMFQLLPAQKGL
jgi:predicted RNA-binding Zn-ribbon protein involved in translation (DUF1610 family)